jgi:hypothetical protein
MVFVSPSRQMHDTASLITASFQILFIIHQSPHNPPCTFRNTKLLPRAFIWRFLQQISTVMVTQCYWHV